MYLEIKIKLKPDITKLMAQDLGEEIKDIIMDRDSEWFKFNFNF